MSVAWNQQGRASPKVSIKRESFSIAVEKLRFSFDFVSGEYISARQNELRSATPFIFLWRSYAEFDTVYIATHILGNEFHWRAVIAFLQPQTTVMSIVSMLLLLSGDIETNPGPQENIGEDI